MCLISCPPPEMLSGMEMGMEAAVQPQELLPLCAQSWHCWLWQQLPCCAELQFWQRSELLCLASWGGLVFTLLFFIAVLSVEIKVKEMPILL